MQILLTGGSGLLGNELRKLGLPLVTPTSAELDITDGDAVAEFVARNEPDVIIHAAAATNNRQIEANPSLALDVNITGTTNIARACLGTRIRLVYLSTDYVYRGDRREYSEDDEILPGNLYAWSKLAGEAAVRAVPNHLIIRTSFGSSEFAYPAAFTDKFASKDYVDRIAPQILEASLSPLTGVLNIGGPRRSLFDYAVERNPDVSAITLGDSDVFTPCDTSMDLSRWQEFQRGEGVIRGVTACRVCGGRDMETYLDLGMMPLANNLAPSAMAARQMERFPMQVQFCKTCSLSQLTLVVDPREMFSHYAYRSSVSQGYARHCRAMAQSVGARLGLGPKDLVVDIAGNDGTLLLEFKEELGVKVLNVDPAENITVSFGRSRHSGDQRILVSGCGVKNRGAVHGKPRLITATNVFAHVDDVREFVFAAGCVSRGHRCAHARVSLWSRFYRAP